MFGQARRSLHSKNQHSKKQWELELEQEKKEVNNQQTSSKEEEIDLQKIQEEIKKQRQNNPKKNNMTTMAYEEDDEEDAKKVKQKDSKQQEETEVSRKKQKKFDWMDTDDELNETSSEEEKDDVDDETLLKQYKDKQSKGGQKPSIPGIGGGQSLSKNPEDGSGQLEIGLSSTDRDSRTVFVCNLAFELNDKEIENSFKKYGRIASIDVPRNEGALINKGRAFIEYYTKEEASKAAVEGNNLIIKGRQLQVSLGLNEAVTTLANSDMKFHYLKQHKNKGIQGQNAKGSKRSRSRSRSVERKKSYSPRTSSNSSQKSSSSSSSSSSKSSSRSSSKSDSNHRTSKNRKRSSSNSRDKKRKSNSRKRR